MCVKESDLKQLYSTLMVPAMAQTGHRDEAEDAVAETVARCWQFRHRVNPSLPLEAFARKVLHNYLVDRWRKQKRNPVTLSLDAPVRMGIDNIPREVAAPTVDPFAEEFSETVQQALRQVPASYRDTRTSGPAAGSGQCNCAASRGGLHRSVPRKLSVVLTEKSGREATFPRPVALRGGMSNHQKGLDLTVICSSHW